jgi:hypothetical protein
MIHGAPVEVQLLKDLVLQAGGHLISSNISNLDSSSIQISKQSILQRSEIDFRLTKSDKPLDSRKSKSVCKPSTHNVDYHWIIDSIYCQSALPLEVY